MSAAEMARLLALIEDGLRVLRTRDGLPVSDEQCQERANNIAAALLGHHLIVPLPEDGEPVGRFPKVADLQALYAQGKPQGHGHSCACRDCKVFNQNRRAQ